MKRISKRVRLALVLAVCVAGSAGSVVSFGQVAFAPQGHHLAGDGAPTPPKLSAMYR